jgi:hypothetical protein
MRRSSVAGETICSEFRIEWSVRIGGGAGGDVATITGGGGVGATGAIVRPSMLWAASAAAIAIKLLIIFSSPSRESAN